MSNVLAYIARPIDLGRADDAIVNHAINELVDAEIPCYNPLGAFRVGGEPSGVINQINKAAMDAASCAVAFLPGDAKTIGVPSEIGYLLDHGVPTLIVTDLDKTSWVVAGWSEQPHALLAELDPFSIAAGVSDLIDLMIDSRAATYRHTAEGIVFEQKHPNATLPTKGYKLDAGYDLYTVEDVVIPARGQGNVSVGVACDIPEGMWAQITGRSSTLKKLNLMVAPTTGVIDEEYTGELFAPIVSVNDEDVTIKAGERVAQLILHYAPGQQYAPVWGVCRDKARGSNGFGSTGK